MSTNQFKRVNFLLGTDPAGQPVHISDQILATGLWMLGPPGMGKTKAMLALIKQGLINSGWGGDGHFPISVKKNSKGLVMEMKVVFNE